MTDAELHRLAIEVESTSRQVAEQAIIVRDKKPDKDFEQWHRVAESLANLVDQAAQLRKDVIAYIDQCD